jgi:GT2 family glycosyltransferase
MDHLNKDTNGKKVALFLITTKGRQISLRVIENLTKLSGLDLFVISHNAIDIKNLINDINDRVGKRIYYFEASGNSVCQKRNLALSISIANEYDYCILSDDDIAIENASDIGELINLFKSLSEECAVLSPTLELAGRPIYGGLLYRNGTFMSFETEPAGSIWYSLCPSAAFIAVRVKSIARMFEVGLRPFEELFVIQSEDVDFAVKVWLLGYKIACTKLVKVKHLASRSQIPSWRLFFMYRNRLLLLLLNFSVRHVLFYLPFRVLNDVVQNIVVFHGHNFSSLVKAYSWALKNLSITIILRNHRRKVFRRTEKILFTKLPLPRARGSQIAFKHGQAKM